jgi:hypothetical protein
MIRHLLEAKALCDSSPKFYVHLLLRNGAKVVGVRLEHVDGYTTVVTRQDPGERPVRSAMRTSEIVILEFMEPA